MQTTMKVDKAIAFAKKWHSDQKYGDKNYVDGHLIPCYLLAQQFTNNDDLLCSVILHDVLEDTDCGEANLLKEFGNRVLAAVWAVSDEGEGSRKEKKKRTYEKLKMNKDGRFVKLIDRVSNTTSGKKNSMYLDEQPDFRKAIYRPGEYEKLWKMIDKNLGIS